MLNIWKHRIYPELWVSSILDKVDSSVNADFDPVHDSLIPVVDLPADAIPTGKISILQVYYSVLLIGIVLPLQVTVSELLMSKDDF